MTDKRITVSFDPDKPCLPARRHTDAPKPMKQSGFQQLPTVSGARPRTKSWNWVSGSMDYSNISLLPPTRTPSKPHFPLAKDPRLLQNTTLDDLIDSRSRRNSGPEARSKRVMCDNSVMVQKEVTGLERPSARKSKSTTRVRAVSPTLVSPHNHSFQTVARSVNGRKSVQEGRKKAPVAAFRGRGCTGQRCVSEGKYACDDRLNVMKGPCACNTHVVDLLLVKRYKEEQDQILATIRDLTSGRLCEPHSILRRHMQAYAPWTASEVGEKGVRFA